MFSIHTFVYLNRNGKYVMHKKAHQVSAKNLKNCKISVTLEVTKS